jgi:CRP-like cAMP-binding protein
MGPTASEVAVFRGLPAEQLVLLKPLMENVLCRASETIIEQGSPAYHLYLILAGRVAIQYKPHDGPRLTVTHLSAGDAFGWSAVVGSPAYTSSVVAVGEVNVLRISGPALRRLCVDKPSLGREVLLRLASVVSSRWKNAELQVKAILEEGIRSGGP